LILKFDTLGIFLEQHELGDLVIV